MERKSIPRDDLLDVSEATDKLEACINEIFEENELSLAVSAFMSGATNSLIKQSRSVEEAKYYLHLFNAIFRDTLQDATDK